ncbi:MAG: hypothetical protein HRU70_15085 [Phycisphaeraceae bacterium]|nr:MAG: hypothetical protein HRU70_15085 [Phycisphaeraceae bacterium]
MMTRALQTLLASSIDYAGLFPPAKLPMPTAAENFARDRAGLHTPLLGRFICPASRLPELSAAAAPLMPGTFATSGYREHARTTDDPWRVSVIADGVTNSPADPLGALKRDLDAVIAFNTRHAAEDHGLAQADCIELKPPSPDFIDAACDEIPDDLYPFFEIAPDSPDPRGFIAALPGHAAAAKLRTGGLTPDAFPSSASVAAFLHACALAAIPFKATAGLHHPFRGPFNCTYEPSSPRATMHGFVNLAVAATLTLAHRLAPRDTQSILDESDPAAFVFTDDGLTYKHRWVADPTQIALARETFFLSFGSCSFDEPLADLKSAGLL